MTPFSERDQMLIEAFRSKSKSQLIDTIGLLLTKAINNSEAAEQERLFTLAKAAIDGLR